MAKILECFKISFCVLEHPKKIKKDMRHAYEIFFILVLKKTAYKLKWRSKSIVLFIDMYLIQSYLIYFNPEVDVRWLKRKIIN